MNCVGADPYIFFDPKSAFYYIYATSNSDEHSERTFYIYKTKDLTHLEYIGEALEIDYNRWGKNWFWAPIVWYNPNNDLYYLFYSARVEDRLLEQYFGDPNYEEGCRIGVATSSSPEGPFRNIADHPIDYHPYDDEYLDISSIISNPMHPDVSFKEAFEKAKRGTYFPLIDIDILFEDNRFYFYFSRCCYKNFVYDVELGKFIEESHIICAEFDNDFWYDKEGKMMPKPTPRIRDSQNSYYELLAYWREPQSWENSHVNDYEKSGGQKKDRRWTEGSTIFKKSIDGETFYFMTYSCNNFENEFYGVGIAYSRSPYGPFRKYTRNPIISQNEKLKIYSTGHGSYINVDGKDIYVFHMRDDKKGKRCIAWCELYIKSTEDISISRIHKCELITH